MEINHRLLTLEEQLALGRRIQQGDKDALAELVEGNVRLVHKIANQWHTPDSAVTLDDLVQIGMIGLLTAARKYEPERGLRFSTYATWWIRQAVSRAALTSGPIPRSANPNYQHQNETSAHIQARRQQTIFSLDAPLRNRKGDESDSTLADITPSAGPSVEEEALTKIEFERLFDALRLDARGEAVIEDWLSGLSREEAGKRHGLSRSWVHFIIKTRKGKLMPPKIATTCIEPGCKEPRMVSAKGTVLSRCDAHQHEYWNQAARIRREREAGRATAETAPVKKSPPVEEEPLPAEPAATDECADTSCDSCAYRKAFDLIVQRLPEARKLLDAIQTLDEWENPSE